MNQRHHFRNGIAKLRLGMIVAFALSWLPGLANAQEIKWRTDYDSARSEAKQKCLPLILDFGSVDCHWCKRLDATTFRNPEISQLINARFVPLRIDAENYPSLISALTIRAYPTIVLAEPEGKILAKVEGYVNAPECREHLQRVLKSLDTPN